MYSQKSKYCKDKIDVVKFKRKNRQILNFDFQRDKRLIDSSKSHKKNKRRNERFSYNFSSFQSSPKNNLSRVDSKSFEELKKERFKTNKSPKRNITSFKIESKFCKRNFKAFDNYSRRKNHHLFFRRKKKSEKDNSTFSKIEETTDRSLEPVKNLNSQKIDLYHEKN